MRAKNLSFQTASQGRRLITIPTQPVRIMCSVDLGRELIREITLALLPLGPKGTMETRMPIDESSSN